MALPPFLRLPSQRPSTEKTTASKKKTGTAYQFSTVETPGCHKKGAQSSATTKPQGSIYRLTTASETCRLDGAHSNQICPTTYQDCSGVVISLIVTASPNRPKIAPNVIKTYFMPRIMMLFRHQCNLSILFQPNVKFVKPLTFFALAWMIITHLP